MRQYVLPPGLTAGADGTIELGGKDARRLASVLRLGAGDRFPALSSDGIRHEAEVLEIRPGFVRLRLSAEAGAPDAFLHDIRAGRRQEASHGEAMQAPKDKLALPRFVLAIGMLKGSKLDDVVRMAVEAGAAAVVPLASERSVPKGEFAGRLARLRRVRDEALGQSGSETRTAIEEPLGLAEFLTLYPAGPDRLGVVFHETPLAEAPLHRYCTDTPGEIVACVGPEGGFSDAELGGFVAGGYEPAWLGPTVLRAETAAVFALASLRILCLERSSWILKKSDA